MGLPTERSHVLLVASRGYEFRRPVVPWASPRTKLLKDISSILGPQNYTTRSITAHHSIIQPDEDQQVIDCWLQLPADATVISWYCQERAQGMIRKEKGWHQYLVLASGQRDHVDRLVDILQRFFQEQRYGVNDSLHFSREIPAPNRA